MFKKRNLSLVALAVAIATPLAAQSSGQAQEARRRAQEGRQRSEAVLTRTRMDSIRNARRQSSDVLSSRIPPGKLPPRGMCRVWIEGVPPGHQPPVTNCADAERERLLYGGNARVVYGDSQSFPGRGKGKFKRQGDDDDDRLENVRADKSSLSKIEKQERKAARKAGNGRG